MNQQVTSLTAAFKTVADYGAKYATDFPAASVGGQQFALVIAAVRGYQKDCVRVIEMRERAMTNENKENQKRQDELIE
ncbi:MAG: hypothetical protein ACREFE_18325, partial [Limisphaerales bacterium]